MSFLCLWSSFSVRTVQVPTRGSKVNLGKVLMVLLYEIAFGLRMNDGIETATQRSGGGSAMKVRGGTGQNTENGCSQT